MELTVYQTLQQGVTAHKEGNLQEAERLYRAILQVEPTHPDANHNLGVIAITVNNVASALPLFKAAIAANPNKEQFWISYKAAVIKDYESGFARTVPHESNDKLSTSELNDSLEQELYMASSDSLFKSPSPIEYPTFYRAGMGTENVGGFLRAMALMLRPRRILEIGAGYTTPFLLEALVNNGRVYDDGNLQKSYFDNYTNDSKLIVIDDISLGELTKKPGMKDIIASKYTEFIEGKFEGKADMLFKKYGAFDFVWYDCGAAAEYKRFMEEYWGICSGYIFFHYTYSDGSPNELHDIILNNITGNPVIFDIVESHKKRQGSITMVKKMTPTEITNIG
jgi:tetratricopeptide (TPR) repeat protein